MPAFDDQIDAFVLSQIPKEDDGWAILEDRGDVNSEGWDTLHLTVAAELTTGLNSQDLATRWQAGTKPTGWDSMYVVSSRPRCILGALYAYDLTCHGLLAPQELKLRISAASDQQQAETISVPGVGLVRRLQVDESSPTVEILYARDDGPGPTDLVGGPVSTSTAAFLNATAPPRTSVWASLPDPLYHYPNGWVLDAVDSDNIPGTTVHFVRERCRYQHTYSP